MAKGIRFQPQVSNPLPNNTDTGLWIDVAGNLIFQKGLSGSLDLSGSVEELLTGEGITSISRTYLNNSGILIPVNTPVYATASGTIAMAGGSTLTKSKFLGITTEAINNGDSGNVAIAGAVEEFTGYAHNDFIYLGNTDGSVVTTPIITDGFYIVLIGLIEGNNLILRPSYMGKA